MYGFMREIEFDDNGTSQIVVPIAGAPFVIRKVEALRVADPLVLYWLSEDKSDAAYFLQSLDSGILSPLMTEAGVMLLLYAKTTGLVQ